MNEEQNVQDLNVSQHNSNEMIAVRASSECELATELLKALRITSALLQGQNEHRSYKIEGNTYRVSDVLDSNNELIGKAWYTLNSQTAETVNA